MKARRIAILGFFAAGTALIQSPARAATVRVEGRQLIVDGAPFTMKGVVYSPTPVGSRIPNYSFSSDSAQPHKTDFPLLKSMGANTVRVLDASKLTQTVLDDAAANGLFVVMGFPVSASDVQSSTGRAAIRADFAGMVRTWATHRAVLMWELGNEVTIDHLSNPAFLTSWYVLLNSAAEDAKTAERARTGQTHPVSASNLDITNIGSGPANAEDASLTNLDVWGITVYRGAHFECPVSVFTQYSTSSVKPLYLSEFGSDALNGTAENQGLQSAVLRTQWGVLENQLSATNASGTTIGGCVFEWTDEWWKSPGSGNSSDAAQDAPSGGDFRNACYTDAAFSEEWLGIASIRSGSTARGLRQVYYTLQSLWNPSGAAGVQNDDLIASVRNFPNPFQAGSSTLIRVQLNRPATLTVRIYDMAGQKVIELGSPTDLGSNLFEYGWSGLTSDGNTVASGLYIVRVLAQVTDREELRYRRIVVVK